MDTQTRKPLIEGTRRRSFDLGVRAKLFLSVMALILAAVFAADAYLSATLERVITQRVCFTRQSLMGRISLA